MSSSITPVFRYDNNLIKRIRNVYCWSEVCCDKLCVHKTTFRSLERSDYQCLQGDLTCQVRKFPFHQQTISFFLKYDPGIYNFEETQKSHKDVFGDVTLRTRSKKKCVYLSANKILSLDDCKKAKLALMCSIFQLRNKNRQKFLDGTHCLARNMSRDYEKRPSPCLKKFIFQSRSSIHEPVP